MEAVTIWADKLPFEERVVPSEDGFEPSELVFGVSDGAAGYGELYIERTSEGLTTTEQESGATGIELVKLKDNSFTGYVQDEYTTLPERENRTLYISLDIFWTHRESANARVRRPNSTFRPNKFETSRRSCSTNSTLTRFKTSSTTSASGC
jgi:urate oxidase